MRYESAVVHQLVKDADQRHRIEYCVHNQYECGFRLAKSRKVGGSSATFDRFLISF